MRADSSSVVRVSRARSSSAARRASFRRPAYDQIPKAAKAPIKAATNGSQSCTTRPSEQGSDPFGVDLAG